MNRREQIRRELGFGQGTLREKLRDYYDPFERRDTGPNVAANAVAADEDRRSADFSIFGRQPWVWDSDWPAVD